MRIRIQNQCPWRLLILIYHQQILRVTQYNAMPGARSWPILTRMHHAIGPLHIMEPISWSLKPRSKGKSLSCNWMYWWKKKLSTLVSGQFGSDVFAMIVYIVSTFITVICSVWQWLVSLLSTSLLTHPSLMPMLRIRYTISFPKEVKSLDQAENFYTVCFVFYVVFFYYVNGPFRFCPCLLKSGGTGWHAPWAESFSLIWFYFVLSELS